MPNHGVRCPCRSCYERFEARSMSWNPDRGRYVKRGGTMNSSAFRTRDRNDGSGKRDTFFNGPGDADRHGHVVERTGADGSTEYLFVRDVEGDVYKDERD